MAMTVRKNKETFAEPVPAHWAGKDALQSHVLNVLSLMFPDGEAFFIRSVKHFADRATSAKMQADIKAFIGQEMQHSMAHERFNAAVAKNVGNMDWFMWLFTVPTFEWLEPFARNIGLNKFALAITAAAENMTAGFAQSLFAPGEAEKILRADVRDLYLWHAAEEMEHRDLAFDLYEQAGGGYATRMAGMAFAYGIIAAYVAVGTTYLAVADKEFPWASLPQQLKDLFTRENSLGRVFLEGMVDYMRRDFHPSQHPMHPDALAYLEKIAS
ncbi:MAG: metal-dependent hydrolase [Spirochaetota bacterium]